jgi:predicted pyridoxine 5'-phosphate oxidase superfamily flavin-nucleotide-binding protein
MRRPGRTPMTELTADMRAVIQGAYVCFAATVTPDGKPNLSPKGTIRVWDDRHLFFLDLASPGTRANLQASPWMELHVVEQLSRRGYRFFGTATVHVADARVLDHEFETDLAGVEPFRVSPQS